VKLTVVGSSPAWPNPGGAQSGYLLDGPGRLLLDCGPGVLPSLRQGGGWPALDAIAITHFHLDHWGDLVPWVWGVLHLRGRGIDPGHPDLWVPPGGHARLEHFGDDLGFPDMFERVFTVREYEPGVPFTAAGHTVTALRVPHYRLASYGFRVANGDTVLAYSGDSAPDARLVELAQEADLFLCEATLLTGDSDGFPPPRGHLSLDEANEAFAASGAKRLLVTHRPVELPTDGVELAYDGMTIDF
jgi:ribonuclease BN (tRNA processing enzyme)